MKETTDKFQRQVTHYLKSTEYQIAHRFDYKPVAGFASVDYNSNTKNEIAQMVNEATSKKIIIIIFPKIILIIPNQ